MVRDGKQKLIAAGFTFFRASRLHRLAAPLMRGRGAALMLHHVRPWAGKSFAPNRLLEVEPAFLHAALTRIRALGFDLVSLDEALTRLGRKPSKPFVTLTFDDGYRDNLEHALPILEWHRAPFTLFVTTGFADRTARLWWIELEDAVAALDRIAVEVDGQMLVMPAATPGEKQAAFIALYWMLRDGPEDRLLDVIATLMAAANLSPAAIVDRLCLAWDGIATMAKHPLCTIGVHTRTHPMLAKHSAEIVRAELSQSRATIEARTGRRAHHLAYPVGDLGAAGSREFAIARDLQFASAVTTRPGMLFPAHRDHPHALPRVSLNGNWQTPDSLEILLSGLPFALWNKGRQLNVS